jgi:hypothetical protein
MYSNNMSLLLFLALASQALSCVQFRAVEDIGQFLLHLSYPLSSGTTILTFLIVTGSTDITITDSGVMRCAVYGAIIGQSYFLECGPSSCVCDSGYTTEFDKSSGTVSYSYGSFHGSFGTNYEVVYSQSDTGDDYGVWTASVWGC